MHIIHIYKSLKLDLHYSFVHLDQLKLQYALNADEILKERIEALQKSIERQNRQLRDLNKKTGM